MEPSGMPPRFAALGPFVLNTYNLAFALAVLTTAGIAAYRLRGLVRTGDWVDACIGALVGGAVGARLAHVLLNWDYFAEHSGEIFQLRAGGLDWHGAVIGGLLGL